MVKIIVDGKSYEVEEGQNLLNACLSLGLNIPYFCWHPALGSVGACRQCAVKQFEDEKDTKGKIVMSCMTPVKEGLRVSIDDPEAKEFRASIIEWLMVNHPHDCPVCDEGGECHLQDMTVLTGHVYRRFRFKKRTFRNQDLGPFVTHEMNRCIVCYRCARFYNDYAGGRDFAVMAMNEHIYFGRHKEGTLQSEFSGNLVEVCPTGVFTDKTLARHYTRKWDLQTAPSICVHCGVGCNTIPGERYGVLRRIRNRFHSQVNGYFLCDRGRYGYEFVNSERRIRYPLVRDADGEARPLTRASALERVASLLSNQDRVIGIGSPRASLEANFALRDLVGPERFYLGVSDREAHLVSTILQILREGSVHSCSLHEVETSDVVLVLGEDVTNTAPMMTLALRQSVKQIPMHVAERLLHLYDWQDEAVLEAIQQEGGPLFLVTSMATRLDEVAKAKVYLAPDDIARLGFAVAHELDPQAPAVDELPDELRALVKDITQELKAAERHPLVISGTATGSAAVLQAAANVAWALYQTKCQVHLFFAVPECNSIGLGLLGGQGLEAAFAAVEDGRADTVIVLENDLYHRADAPSVDRFFANAPHVVAVDCLMNGTTGRAEVVLPAATFAETDGTLVNNEGRAQCFYQVFVTDGDIQASWRWARDLMLLSGRQEVEWQIVDDVRAALAEQIPLFAPILKIAPPADFGIVGQKIARQTHRYSGRTAMYANLDVNEPPPPKDPDSPLAFSMEGYQGVPPPSLILRYWAPHWNSVQALNKSQQEIGGQLRGEAPGKLLIEARQQEVTYFRDVPVPFHAQEGEWLVIPLNHIYGSEELSLLTPGIAQLAPGPYLAVNSDDAAALDVAEGQIARLTVKSMAYDLPVRLSPALPQGVIGVPVGIGQLQGLDLPAWGQVRKEQYE